MITPKMLLDQLGLDYIERPNRLSMRCPFHHDTHPSAAFYDSTQLFYCYACQIALDMVSFYARLKEVPRNEAALEVERLFGSVPERRQVDSVLLLRTRTRAEKLLGEHRELGILKHASLGELLDKIVYAFERGQVNEDQLDRAVRKWYSKVEEVTNAGPQCPGTPETGADVRVEEGLAGLFGLDGQGGSPALDDHESDGSVDLA